MEGKERRQLLLDELKKNHKAVSATNLARQFDVSRQIIVGDIALLRASGENIQSTPRGYLLPEQASRYDLVKRIACNHKGEDMGAELNAIVDQGCDIIDVIVEHPVYGEISGCLQIHSRYDVSQFLEKCEESKALPLSFLTEGIHLHTLSCPDEEAYERVIESLRDLGFLYETAD